MNNNTATKLKEKYIKELKATGDNSEHNRAIRRLLMRVIADLTALEE